MTNRVFDCFTKGNVESNFKKFSDRCYDFEMCFRLFRQNIRVKITLDFQPKLKKKL